MASQRPFLLERYFAIHEFTAKYVACGSDGESLSINDILCMNNSDEKSTQLVDKLWYNMKLGYTESQGSTLLRQEICNMYNNEYDDRKNNNNSALKQENVLIIAPQEGIYIAMNCLLNKNDHIIVLSPSYQSLYENALANNIAVTFWKFRINKNNNWYLDINELENTLIKVNKTKMIVINFPHNPTGYVPSYNEYCQILNIAKKYNIIIFSDEMYWFLFAKHNKLKSAVMSNDNNIITLSGMSKTFCCPGLRIGWLITRNQAFMDKFQAFKDYITICPPSPSEVLSIFALRNKNYRNIIGKIQKIIAKNKHILYQFVTQNNDIFYWTQYENDGHCGGLTKFIGYQLGNVLSVQLFCDYVVKQCGVMLLPSTMYQYDGEKEFIRFGLGRKNLENAVKILDKYLAHWRQNRFVVENNHNSKL